MADREYIYNFKIDAAQAKREAGQIARIFNTALRDIELKPKISVANLGQIQQTIQRQMAQVQAQVKPVAATRNPAALDPYKAQLLSAKLLREEIKDREKEERQNLAILNDQTSALRMQEALLTKREISLRRQARDAQAVQLGMNPSAFRGIRGTTIPTPVAPMPSQTMGGGLMGGINQLQNIASFSIGGYAVSQMASAALQAGKLGAENVRLARSYDLLAKGAGLAGDSLANKLSSAVQQTVTQQKLMASTNMLLASAQDGQIKVTEEQIATLAKFARLRSTQLTANGRPMSTEEAYGRLIQGTVKRETELLDELGLSTKSMAAQLGVPIESINKDVESLLSAITKVAQVEINRFGEPILDEATRIEQAATRIEEAKNRINAALAEPAARVYEFGASATEAVIRAHSPLSLSQSRQNIQQQLDQANRYSIGDFGANQLPHVKQNAELVKLIDKVTGAMKNGVPVSAEFVASLTNVAREVEQVGTMSSKTEQQFQRLVQQFNIGATAAYNQAGALEDTIMPMNEAEKAALRLADAQAIANGTFLEAQKLLRMSANGVNWVQFPSVGWQPEQGPNGPSPEWLQNRQERMQGGGFLTPGGNRVADLQTSRQQQWYQGVEQETKDAIREREQAQKDAIRENERAWKSTANDVKQAFRDAASELESSVRAIPGLFGRSDVTAEQVNMAKLGVPQNFADNYLRQLTDEVLNGVDWANVSLADAASRAGIDQALDPKAQLAIFSQKWADQSLFANASNLDLFDQGAIRAEMERQRQSQLGQENIMSLFGLGKDSEGGTVFKDLGSMMAGGMKAGAEEGLAEFGRDAIANTMVQLKSDAAIAEYTALGSTLSEAMFNGFAAGTMQTDLVGIIVAEVTRNIYDRLDDGQ